ncbi:polynucleotide adenylyltransferase PcnB [bacterium]|nr:polynucleotide adenylyltransferase PcnB [bacterium]
MIVPRGRHSISRRDIDEDALKVMYRLRKHGYLAYLVGGGVRDILLERRPKDFDIATDARPEEVRAIFRNSRLIGRRFQLVHVFFFGGKIIEVSTFRRSVPFADDEDPCPESEQKKRQLPSTENTFGSAYEDAMRRDITINALFYNIEDFSIIDYVGGMDDLRAGVIRAVGCPHRSFGEDPVRMLRVIRHAARTGFEIDANTRDAIAMHREKICRCAAARVREEFLRELRGGVSRRSFELMMETGFLAHLFPAYAPILSGPDGAETTDYLLSNLQGIDRLVAAGENLPDPMLVSALVAPFVVHHHVMERAEGVKRLASFVHDDVRETIRPIIRDFGLSRGHAEAICQNITGKMLLTHYADLDREIPRSLWAKSYFLDGFTLYRIEAEGRDQPIGPRVAQAAAKAEERLRQSRLANGHADDDPGERPKRSRSRGGRGRRRRRPPASTDAAS